METKQNRREKIKIFFKHLLVTILIDFVVFMISYTITGILGVGYLGFDILIFAVIVIFFGSITMYFLYVRKKLKWFLICNGSLLLPVVLYLLNVDVHLMNLFHFSRLPKQFIEYQDIEKPVLEFKNKEIILLADGSANLSEYLSPQNDFIVKQPTYSIEEKKDINLYYRFDSKGNFIAKFSLPRDDDDHDDEILFEGYFINIEEEYYRLWTFNGDTSKIKMKTYNDEFLLDTIKQNAFLANIQKKAAFLRSKDCNTTEGEDIFFQKVAFLKDNKWNVFYYDSRTHRIIKDKGLSISDNDLFAPDSKSNELLFLNTYDRYVWSRANSSENIQSQYFQKIKLARYEHSYKRWEGYLYTNIIVGKDTLKIKESLLMSGEDALKYHPSAEIDEIPHYIYYSNPNIEFQLFKNESGKLYMIRNKPKIQKKT